jgi:hypothetical protein
MKVAAPPALRTVEAMEVGALNLEDPQVVTEDVRHSIRPDAETRDPVE